MANVVRDESSESAERDTARLAGVRVVDPGDAPGKVAILCAQARLRTILRLSLQADDHGVVEWNHRTIPDNSSVVAIVIDLDSLGRDAQGALGLLDSWGVDNSTPLLFISVYPLDLRPVQRVGPYGDLQPPFSPSMLIERVRSLLRDRIVVSGPGTPNGPRLRGNSTEAAPRGEPCIHS